MEFGIVNVFPDQCFFAFEFRTVLPRRRAIELPFHLINLNEFDRLKSVFLDFQMFKLLDSAVSHFEFIKMWEKVAGSYYMVTRYLENALKERWPQEWFPEAVKVSQ